jgi:hypothetical protein
MRYSLRTLWTGFAALALIAGLGFAPTALAGFEPCDQICSFSSPNRGCSCSNPYYNINCGTYALYGCGLERGAGAELPQAAAPTLGAELGAVVDFSCQALPVVSAGSDEAVTQPES